MLVLMMATREVYEYDNKVSIVLKIYLPLLKVETHIVYISIGWNFLDNDYDSSSPAVSLLDTNICINLVILDTGKGLGYCTVDVFFIKNSMKIYRCTKVPIKYLINKIRQEYNIDGIVHSSYICIYILKHIYGLTIKQSFRCIPQFLRILYFRRSLILQRKWRYNGKHYTVKHSCRSTKFSQYHIQREHTDYSYQWYKYQVL